ncbi:hypothetical protein DPMN_080379 [Dreissena polymorpha]|uniref:Uncharacterized protein n=1 Tax=Dreissena polymorpha TaxID=45954 RepID=A0A9D3YVI3_DREPO|nr:hypothetical protein DPMN_080379 [Dreissena polymorpha]
MLAAASQSSGTEELPSRSRAPEPMFESTPYLNQDQMKAELASQVSDFRVPGDMERFPSPVCKAFVPQASVVSARSCGGDRHADTV